ncbi:MAG: hypothetical protein OEV21_01515 [Thermoplasmata archaeon]|nr:hypothetical protein [Thermoplasmata archaeon]
MSEHSKIVKDLEKILKKNYSEFSLTENHKIIQGLERFLRVERQKSNLAFVLHEAALMINRVFPFKEVSIGMRGPIDGLYRYIEVLGLSPTAKSEHMKLRYTQTEMFDFEKYPAFKISRFTDFRYSDDQPTGSQIERKAFSRPSLLSLQRNSLEEMLEGDYIDIYIFDLKDQIIGWIEVAQPRDGKIPSMSTIRWLEFLALLISPIIERHVNEIKTAESLSTSKSAISHA